MTLRIPIFPLDVVLFPETTIPLHLFEPRYRRLLADIEAGDRRFGLLCAVPGTPERELPAGRIGSLAEVVTVEPLPDGRSNILVRGAGRFLLDGFIDDPAPYHLAQVRPLEDTPGTNAVALAVAADELATQFRRIVRAVEALSEEPGAPPTLADDPVTMTWQVAAMIDLDYDTRVRLLAMPEPAARVAHLDGVLRKVLPELELRAALHRSSRDGDRPV